MTRDEKVKNIILKYEPESAKDFVPVSEGKPNITKTVNNNYKN